MQAEKASHKIQPPFMIKTLDKLKIEGNHVNITKALYTKPGS